jgi:hypothetical protein
LSDDRDTAYRKARETLENIGWVFDAFIKSEMTAILKSDPNDTNAREEAYRRARVATELKTALLKPVDEYEDEMIVQKHKEAKNGHREQQQHHH